MSVYVDTISHQVQWLVMYDIRTVPRSWRVKYIRMYIWGSVSFYELLVESFLWRGNTHPCKTLTEQWISREIESLFIASASLNHLLVPDEKTDPPII